MSMSTPWWVTALLMIATLAITHFLTLWRERAKQDKDWLDRWSMEVKSSVRKISDDAVTHFVSQDSIQNTPVSSALIVAELKRLSAAIAETSCVQAADSLKTNRALAGLRDCVTMELDFQNPGRVSRPSDDPLISRIHACEAEIREAICCKRVRK